MFSRFLYPPSRTAQAHPCLFFLIYVRGCSAATTAFCEHVSSFFQSGGERCCPVTVPPGSILTPWRSRGREFLADGRTPARHAAAFTCDGAALRFGAPSLHSNTLLLAAFFPIFLLEFFLRRPPLRARHDSFLFFPLAPLPSAFCPANFFVLFVNQGFYRLGPEFIVAPTSS